MGTRRVLGVPNFLALGKVIASFWIASLVTPKRDQSGERWHLAYWCNRPHVVPRAQRLFFWNDDLEQCGVIVLVEEDCKLYKFVKKQIEWLLDDTDFRLLHSRPLRFPIGRYYEKFGSFAEESR